MCKFLIYVFVYSVSFVLSKLYVKSFEINYLVTKVVFFFAGLFIYLSVKHSIWKKTPGLSFIFSSFSYKANDNTYFEYLQSSMGHFLVEICFQITIKTENYQTHFMALWRK